MLQVGMSSETSKKFFLFNQMPADLMFPKAEPQPRQLCSNCERYFKTLTPGETRRPFFKVEKVDRRQAAATTESEEMMLQ